MANDLGALIASEVTRAETDIAGARTRGQAVLTVSGALVTLLAAVVALTVGKDAKLTLSGLPGGAAIVALGAFVVATVFVLFIFWPSTVDAVSSSDIANFAQNNWEDDGWEQQVAIVLSTYLRSLRSANKHLSNMLRGAVTAEVIGIASAAVMTMSLVQQAA